MNRVLVQVQSVCENCGRSWSIFSAHVTPPLPKVPYSNDFTIHGQTLDVAFSQLCPCTKPKETP